MHVHILPALSDNYIYLLEHENQLAVMDPGEAGAVQNFLAVYPHLQLRDIFLTHGHPDHVDGVDALRGNGVTVRGPKLASCPVDEILRDGDRFDWLGQEMRVLATPGHTRECHSYFLPGLPALFCGDLLFVGGCGRLFTGNATAMFDSLQKIKALPAETKIYCGHEYTRDNARFARAQYPEDETIASWIDQIGACNVPTTLKAEREHNLFLRADSVEAFARLRAAKDQF